MKLSNAQNSRRRTAQPEKTFIVLPRKPSPLPNFKKPLTFAALLALSVLVAVGFGVYAYKNFQRKSFFEISENTIFVKAGGDFQAALDHAQPGGTILLEAGATFKGVFKLPNKLGNEFITIRSSATGEEFPPADARLSPTKYAVLLPKLESSTKGQPVILAVNGAHHFRFIGIEFMPTVEGIGNIIQLGTSAEKNVSELPHHIEFDRVWVHGSEIYGQRRGIAANGRNIKIQNSYISDIKRRDEESQAIAVWATDGPVEIFNNYLEAGAENILFGGAGSTLKLVPTDCLVKGNHLNKPLKWRQENWIVKNLFEIKNGRRINVEDNLMTNNWGMAQDGIAILFTTRADNGDATIIEDIAFTGNIVRGIGGGINVYGAEGSGGHRLLIRNNLFEDVDGRKWGSAGHFMTTTEWDGLIVENNTVFQTGSITNAYGAPVKNFVFRNNIVFENEYGFKGDNVGSGQETIDKFLPNGTVTDNIIVGGKASIYKEKNYFPNSIKQIGFANAENGDYRLSSDSPYLNKGFGNKQIGANLNFQSVGEN